MTGLDLTLLYLIAAVLGVAAVRLLELPPVLGYLVVGILIGPQALALTAGHQQGAAQHLAEFGVVFLMFSIGLEFSLTRLRAMRDLVFGLGAAQLGISMAAVLLLSLALGALAPSWWSRPLSWGLALGGALAMSSTAIAVRLLADRLELESGHGRRVIGVLLFQDLAVVPLLVLIPALAGPASPHLLQTLGLALLKGSLVLALILFAGGRLLGPWLRLMARRKSDELFMLNLLLLTLGLAWLTEWAGLSLALGAFVAGMLIAETEFRHQVEADIRPFRDVLLGLFFITIGMQLDWRLALRQWWVVLLLAVLPQLLKAALLFGVQRLRGTPPGLALRSALWLAPAGEFGIVLLNLAGSEGVLPHAVVGPVLAAAVLSMLAAPLLMAQIDAIVLRLVASEWLQASLQLTDIARQAIKTRRHVLIVGFGRCGQNLARLLRDEDVPYVALDLDPDRVAAARASGEAVVFGDGTRIASLQAAGLGRACAVAITYLDARSAARVLHLVRSHAPQLPAVVRTRDDAALDTLRGAGATEVVPEIFEGALMLASQAMAAAGVPLARVMQRLHDARAGRYQLLRDYFHGAGDAESAQQSRLSALVLPAHAAAVGQRVDQLQLHGARLLRVRRGAAPARDPEATLQLQCGDALVLAGSAQQLALAEDALLGGGA